jgi:hypothetical protein
MFIEHIQGLHAMSLPRAKSELWAMFFRAYNLVAGAGPDPDNLPSFDEVTARRAEYDAGYQEDLKTLEAMNGKSANS